MYGWTPTEIERLTLAQALAYLGPAHGVTATMSASEAHAYRGRIRTERSLTIRSILRSFGHG